MVFKVLYQVIKMFISAVNFTHFGSLKWPLDVQLVSCHLATHPSTQMEEQMKDRRTKQCRHHLYIRTYSWLSVLQVNQRFPWLT